MNDQQQQPVPFEIVEQPGGQRVASDGRFAVVVLEDLADATLFRRRGVSGLPLRPPAEVLLPQLNQLAGELLERGAEFDAERARARVLAIAGTVAVAEPVRTEAVVVDVQGLRIYVSAGTVIVTRQDLRA